MRILNPLIRGNLLEKREYQLKIADNAIKKNTLVVLPTALGKTVISALVASYFLYYYSNYKILVLAPTKPLAIQHRETFLKILKVKPDDTKVLTGKYPPDYRVYLWNQPHKIYFATPQTVENDLENGLDLSRFSLIIFDECHRARGKYSYVKIAEEYVRKNPYPMILGLTASPGSDKDRILEICENLFIEHIEVRDEDDPDVKPYIKPIDIKWIYVHLPKSYSAVLEYIREMLMDRFRILRETGLLKKDPKHTYKSDLIEIRNMIYYKIELTMLDEELGKLYHKLSVISEALMLYHALELLESQGPYTLLKFLLRMEEDMKRSSKRIVSSPLYSRIKEYIKNLEEHPKMDKLFQTILREAITNTESKVIVFTQYRDTASYITMRLREMGLKAERFVGQASRYEDKGLKQDEQTAIIERFRKGDIKVLVATSIAEEGLDIPSVDLVVFYEPVPSEIRYIQRRGRTGRFRPGKVVILATYNTLDTAYLRSSGRRTLRMKKMIREMNNLLRPKLNRGPRPPMKILDDNEIREADKYILEKSPIEISESYILDETSIKIFNKDVRNAAKELLNYILRIGRKGIYIDNLMNSYEDEYPPSIIRSALKKLESENQVKIVNEVIYPEGKEDYDNTHVVEIEKILRGKAIVIVDDKWRAILYPENYSGPRYLLKRGRRLKTFSKLYKIGGKLHIRIYNVLKLEE